MKLTLAQHVVAPSALAVHAGADAALLQDIDGLGAGNRQYGDPPMTPSALRDAQHCVLSSETRSQPPGQHFVFSRSFGELEVVSNMAKDGKPLAEQAPGSTGRPTCRASQSPFSDPSYPR